MKSIANKEQSLKDEEEESAESENEEEIETTVTSTRGRERSSFLKTEKWAKKNI